MRAKLITGLLVIGFLLAFVAAQAINSNITETGLTYQEKEILRANNYSNPTFKYMNNDCKGQCYIHVKDDNGEYKSGVVIIFVNESITQDELNDKISVAVSRQLKNTAKRLLNQTSSSPGQISGTAGSIDLG